MTETETEMTSAEVQKELVAITHVAVGKAETAESFTARVFKKLNSLLSAEEKKSDDGKSSPTWDAMTEAAQLWFNENQERDEEKKPMILLTLPELPAGDEDSDNRNKEERNVAKSKRNGNGAAAPKKTAAAKKAAKPAKAAKGEGSGRGRKPMFDDAQKIHILVDENPHREGSGRYTRWKKYKENMTVKEAIAAGFNYGNLYHSVKDGHIKIS